MKKSFTFHVLPSLVMVFGMFTWPNWFLRRKPTTLLHEEFNNFVLSGLSIFAALELLIHRVHELKHFELELYPTSPPSKFSGAYGRLAPVFSLGFLFFYCGFLHFLIGCIINPTIVIKFNNGSNILLDMIFFCIKSLWEHLSLDKSGLEAK